MKNNSKPQKMTINLWLLQREKYSKFSPVEKLLLVAQYFGESELKQHINNYIKMEKTYQEIGDQLLEAGFTIPNSSDVISFFKNKILDIYFNDYEPTDGFITWLNN